MSPFTAYRLRFTLEVVQPLTLPEPRGAALRGALLEALWRQHSETNLGTVAEPDGQLPRPYTIEPPLTASGQYAAGQQLTFSLTLFAAAHDLVPSLISAVRQWQTVGIGARQPRHDGETRYRGRRGRVRLLRVLAENPFTAQRQLLWASDWQHHRQPALSPTLAITAAHVTTAAQNWPLDEHGAVQLTFHTPTRLIARGQLVRSPQPRVLVARLVQRLRALGQAFAAGDTPGLPGDDPQALLAPAAAITLQADETAWVDQWSPSRRLRRTTPIGGFVGRAGWEGEQAAMRALLPLLLWGNLVHVGKDTVKGNGWYDLAPVRRGCVPSPASAGRARVSQGQVFCRDVLHRA